MIDTRLWPRAFHPGSEKIRIPETPRYAHAYQPHEDPD